MAEASWQDHTIFVGRFISTPAPNDLSIRHGAVLIDGQGVIEKVKWVSEGETNSMLAQALKSWGIESFDGRTVVLDDRNEEGFFFPGFIDTHVHAPQYPNIGLFGKSTLLEWLQRYTFPMESSLGSLESPFYKERSLKEATRPNPLERAQAVYSRVINRSLSNGTTTASYYSTNHVSTTKLLFDLAHSMGQRAFIGRACMDNPATCPEYYRDPSTEATIAAEKECISHARSLDPQGKLVAPIITPRFAPSCLDTTLSALGKLAKSEDLRIQTHISENTSEVDLVKHLFPDSKDYASVYDTHNLLTEKTVLAHAVHLTTEERALIKKRGSKIAHCPASNSALGSGMCPVRTLLDDGIEVGLGTDMSGGYSPSILEAVRQACLVSRIVGFSYPRTSSSQQQPPFKRRFSVSSSGAAETETEIDHDQTTAINDNEATLSSSLDPSHYNLSTTEALHLATIGGANVLNLHGKLGDFVPGMFFDVQEVKLNPSPGGPYRAEEKEIRAKDTDNLGLFGWETWEEKIDKWVWNGDERNVARVWVAGRLVGEKLA